MIFLGKKKRVNPSGGLTPPNTWTISPNVEQEEMSLLIIPWIISTHEEEKNQTQIVSFPLVRGHWWKSEINHFFQYIPKYFWQANVRSASFQYFWYWRRLTNLIRKFQNGITLKDILSTLGINHEMLVS